MEGRRYQENIVSACCNVSGESVSVPVTRTAREYGMCMEMKDAAALKAYDDDPYHKVWTEAYSKIRVDGTTTFNIPGQ